MLPTLCMSFAQSILSDVVTWTIKFLQAVALFCADVFILGVFGCQTFFSDILAFHVCRDRCSLGLAPISGGFNVKIITVMPIQDKGPRPAQSHYTEAHTTVSHHNWVTRRISADNERVLQVH